MGRGFTRSQRVGMVWMGKEIFPIMRNGVGMARMGQGNFLHHVEWSGNGVRQNYVRRGRKTHHSNPSRLIVIPTYNL